MNLWLATRNKTKLEEIKEILGAKATLKSLHDVPQLPEIEETGTTYLENSRLKAKALWNLVKEPVFADDSGLEVDALGGRPGVHSMRFSSPNPTHEKNIKKLLFELRGKPIEERKARFCCVIAYLDSKGIENFFEGILEGHIGFETQGTGGFGYDPIFYLRERGCTLAQLGPNEKNSLSHRFQALRKLIGFLSL